MGTSLTGVKIKDSYDSLLKVTDNGPLDGSLQVITDGLGNNSALSLSTAGASVGGTLEVSGNATFDTNTLFVDAANNRVGVGTNTPNTLFHISKGSIGDYMKVGGDNANSARGLLFTSSTTSSTGDTHTINAISTNGVIAFATDSIERMRVAANGDISFRDSSANEAFYWDASVARLGINELTPLVPLHISKNTASGENIALILDNNDTTANAEVGLLFRAATGGQNTDFQISTINTAANQANLVFRSDGGTERMRIESSGVVQVRNDSAVFQLYNTDTSVATDQELGSIDFYTSDISAARVSSYVKSTFNSAFGDSYLTFGTSTGVSAPTERMRITSGGDVLFSGKTSSSVLTVGGQMQSNGSVWAIVSGDVAQENNRLTSTGDIVRYRYNGTVVGTVSVTGSSTAYNTSSDYRLKEDWVAMEGALDRVDALKPINFAWKVDGSRVDGFLAHELAEVVPEAVSGEKDATEIRSVEVSPAVLDEEGNVITEAVYEEQEVPVYQGIDQSKITPLLTAAIKELISKVKKLEEELSLLKNA